MNSAQQLIHEIEKEIQIVKDNVLSLNYEIDALKVKAKDLEKVLDAVGEKKLDKIEFTPVRSLVYGAVGLMLTLLLGAIVALVLTK